jgi:hypothetical protein
VSGERSSPPAGSIPELEKTEKNSTAPPALQYFQSSLSEMARRAEDGLSEGSTNILFGGRRKLDGQGAFNLGSSSA